MLLTNQLQTNITHLLNKFRTSRFQLFIEFFFIRICLEIWNIQILHYCFAKWRMFLSFNLNTLFNNSCNNNKRFSKQTSAQTKSGFYLNKQFSQITSNVKSANFTQRFTKLDCVNCQHCSREYTIGRKMIFFPMWVTDLQIHLDIS